MHKTSFEYIWHEFERSCLFSEPLYLSVSSLLNNALGKFYVRTINIYDALGYNIGFLMLQIFLLLCFL